MSDAPCAISYRAGPSEVHPGAVSAACAEDVVPRYPFPGSDDGRGGGDMAIAAAAKHSSLSGRSDGHSRGINGHVIPRLIIPERDAMSEDPHTQETGGSTANNYDWTDQSQFAHLPPLPENWIRVLSKSTGATYYCNLVTNETTFTEPTFESEELKAKAQLPPGWEQMVSRRTGKVYYWNRVLQRSQFERPTASTAEMQQADPVALPRGWVQMVTRSTGVKYYYHPDTGTSQYERPKHAEDFTNPPERNIKPLAAAPGG